jgi:hypothetical protein
MNFFNTHHHCNGYSHCQPVQPRKPIFYNLRANRNNFAASFWPDKTRDRGLVRRRGPKSSPLNAWEFPNQAGFRNFDRPGPNRRRNPFNWPVLQQFAGSLEVLGQKKPRPVSDAVQRFMRATRDSRLTRPVRNRRRLANSIFCGEDNADGHLVDNRKSAIENRK